MSVYKINPSGTFGTHVDFDSFYITDYLLQVTCISNDKCRISGNPGSVEYYDRFMECLHEESGWPVWGLSHAGHSVVPQHVKWNGRCFNTIVERFLKKIWNYSVYSLEQQYIYRLLFKIIYFQA